MKKLITAAAVLCSFFIACNSNSQNGDDSSSSSTSSSEKDEKKNVTKRDYGITAANSYSDLFLDSMDVVKYITDNNLPDSSARRMKSFYNARNYQYAWFTSAGLTEQALGFWSLSNYNSYNGDTSIRNKSFRKAMDGFYFTEDLKVNAANKTAKNTELNLTRHFIAYSRANYEKGVIKRKEMERFVPTKRETSMELADSLISKKHKDNKYFEDVNKQYKALKHELEKYYAVAKKGGWPVIPANAKAYKKGSSGEAIQLLKKRLTLSGDMPAGDTSMNYDDTLETAINKFQQRLGYTQNGTISATLIKDINVSVDERIKQILINLNRMRWMPQEPSGKLILVNIPEFILHVMDNKQKVFDMNVVVGKEGHNTMMFTGRLSQVVFSPYWNVPESIVEKEVLPNMEKNPNYLTDNNMEITGEVNGLPVVRQLPGEKNSLGRVKFLFPNSFDIYFHDTPSKSLFTKDKRAYSHGCIRLSEPEKFAEYLLKDDSNWPPDKITEAMYADEEKFVRVKDPVPVYITYYTAWVDENGLLNFRDDIYGRDTMMEKKMFN
jgi:murein L,D-transpeptidase YcbB/YkuD